VTAVPSMSFCAISRTPADDIKRTVPCFRRFRAQTEQSSGKLPDGYHIVGQIDVDMAN